jgi:hypothetical protein
MSTIASNDSLCGPNTIPSVIPAVDMSSDWCATPIVSNQTLNAMNYCCASQQVHTVDSCAYCYLTEAMLENEHTKNPAKRFSGCISSRAETLNATMQRITACHTPNFKSAAAVTKGVSLWKAGIVAVLLSVASWSL